jgi:hypothetical protein
MLKGREIWAEVMHVPLCLVLSFHLSRNDKRSYHRLNAKRAAAAAGALHVRIIELEAGTLDGFDVIDLNAIQIHRAHLVNRDLEPVKIHDLIGLIGLVFKRHMVLETRAASADDGNAQRHRDRILHAHDFLDLGAGSRSQTNHNFFWPPLAGKPAMHLSNKV